MELAPVYDCGSSLFPQADEDIMKSVMNNPEELYYRVFEIPKSAIRVNGNKINYSSFISSFENKECNEALARIYPRINMKSINNIIDETPAISDLQKSFYKTVLQARKELILEKSYNRLLLRNNEIASKDTVFISPKDFGEEYIREVFNNLKTMSIKESAKVVSDKLIKSKEDRKVRQLMLNVYLKSIGVHNNPEFEAYIQKNSKRTHEVSDKKKQKSPSHDDGLGR